MVLDPAIDEVVDFSQTANRRDEPAVPDMPLRSVRRQPWM